MKTILALMLKGVIFWGILILLILAFIMIRIALKGIRLYEFYYPSGKVSSRAYLNRYKAFDGLEKKFYENGNLKAKIKWRKNILNGISYFYYEDGNLESIIPYKNGIINGIVTHFYDNRKLKYKSLFKNGIEEKILEFYDKDGNKIKDNL